MKHEFYGQHVLAELYGVSPVLLDDEDFLVCALKSGIEISRASLRLIRPIRFEPAGISVMAILSESHASIHTYPERNALFVDAFTCGHRCDPQLLVKELIDRLQPARSDVQVIERGRVLGEQEQ